MNKVEVLEKLQSFRDRLESDVVPAYAQRGSSFGRERFSAWKTQFSKFLDQNIPGASSKFNAKLQRSVYMIGRGESEVSVFMREDGQSCFAFIDSLIIDVKNDEFDFFTATRISSEGGTSQTIAYEQTSIHRSWPRRTHKV